MNNGKEVLISIHSIHDCDSGEPDITDFSTDGLYRFEDGAVCLEYYESEVVGLEGTLTSVRIMGDQVTIVRTGVMNSTMILHGGSRESFAYPTPCGSICMTADTRKIRQSFDPCGGTLEIDYILSMEHVYITRNRLLMRVSEIK